jgi:hypothetical protein
MVWSHENCFSRKFFSSQDDGVDFLMRLLNKAFDDVHVIPFKEAWSVNLDRIGT